MIPRWSQRAKQAIVGLWRPLQDIDVFVEDSGREAFYSELLKRIAPAKVRIEKVFPLSGRTSVIEKAKQHDFSKRAALFLIDGDLEWVKGESAPVCSGLYRLEAYCIENLLISELAIVRFLAEQNATDETSASTSLDFPRWREEVTQKLLPLFAAFATLNRINPDEPTVSRGVTELLANQDGIPVLDTTKIIAVRCEIISKAKSAGSLDSEAVDRVYAETLARLQALKVPCDAISGKDYLFHLIDFRIRLFTSVKCTRKSMMFRLAKNCDPTRFEGLTAALMQTSRP